MQSYNPGVQGWDFLRLLLRLLLGNLSTGVPSSHLEKGERLIFGPIFLMHLNNRIRDCCFFLHTKLTNLHIFKRSWLDNDFPCPVSVLNMSWLASPILVLAWTFPIPNRRGLQYSRFGEMKDLYSASIMSIGTKRQILLSAPVFAYAFFSWLEICSLKFNMLSSSTPKILIEGSVVTPEPFKVKSKSYSQGPIGRACVLALFINN